MFSSTRPSENRCSVAVCWAASVGGTKPGRNATRNFSRSVSASSAAAVSQASSHHVPVGVSTPSYPSRSAARATSARYRRLGAR